MGYCIGEDPQETWKEKDLKEQVEVLTNKNKELTEQLRLCGVGRSNGTDWKDAYKECFEMFIPSDQWDEATLFLSTYGCGLAKELARKER